MDVACLSASQLAYIIRLTVFMDNHQTQGQYCNIVTIWYNIRLGYLMKTITKLLVQLEVTKAQRDFQHINSETYKKHVERQRGRDKSKSRAKSMPYGLAGIIIHLSNIQLTCI